MSGFKNRKRRVARRTERDMFRQTLMPASLLLGIVGVLILLGVAVHFSSTGSPALEIASVACGLIALPCVLQLYRVVRGHHSDALDEP
jgi:hypothetical protein